MNFFRKIYATIQALDNVRNGYRHIADREDRERRAANLVNHIHSRGTTKIYFGSRKAASEDRVRFKP